MIGASFFEGPRGRAHAATAILAALLVALAITGISAWLSIAGRAALLADRRFDLEAIAARAKARNPGLARAERTLSADPFLPGASPALAANGMQTRLVGLAEDCGVALKTLGAEPATDVEPGTLPRVTVQATARGKIEAIQKLLYRLETETPFVLVDDVSIRPAPAALDGSGGSRTPDLDVDLRLIGFLHRKGAEG